MKTYLKSALVIAVTLFCLQSLFSNAQRDEGDEAIKPLKDMDKVYVQATDTFTPHPYKQPLPSRYSEEYILPGMENDTIDLTKLSK